MRGMLAGVPWAEGGVSWWFLLGVVSLGFKAGMQMNIV